MGKSSVIKQGLRIIIIKKQINKTGKEGEKKRAGKIKSSSSRTSILFFFYLFFGSLFVFFLVEFHHNFVCLFVSIVIHYLSSLFILLFRIVAIRERKRERGKEGKRERGKREFGYDG